MANGRIELTESDVKKIEDEIREREVVIRPELIAKLKEAREQGDLSENFEYYAAKKEKNRNESRIRYLEGMLKKAVIISDVSKEDEVGLNDTVTIYIEEDDEEQSLRIVTAVRSKSLENKVSIESPIGKAIIGHKVGDRVAVRVNSEYTYYVVIRAIDKTTGEEGDEINKY